MGKYLSHEEFMESLEKTECLDHLEILGSYVNIKIPILVKCKHCGNVYHLTPNRIRLNKNGCSKCSNKNLHCKTHEEYLNDLKNLENNTLEPIEKYVNLKTLIVHKCTVCGNNFKISPISVLNRNKHKGRNIVIGCQNCNKKIIHKIIIGKDDLWTTHPHIAECLIKPELGYKHSYGSSKKLDFKCPDCGHVKNQPISRFVRQGFGCPKCSDNQSFPEKFITNLLIMNNINNFKNDIKTNWSEKYRYDFIIDNKIIIETHGEQHYIERDALKFGKSLEEQNKIDQYKKELALNNGIKYYIELDCSKRNNLEWIKKSIFGTNLDKILKINLDNFNWKECYLKSQRSNVMETLSLWNEGFNATEISEKLKINYSTVGRYLKKVCDKYDSFRSKKKKVRCINTGQIFNSLTEASKHIGQKSYSNIGACCYGRRDFAGITSNGEKLKWEFYNE